MAPASVAGRLGSSNRVDRVRRHLSLHLVGDIASRLDEWRHQWDAVMAVRTPPHVTLVYPEEATDEAMLLDRMSALATDTAPLTLRLTEVTADGGGAGGVFVAIEDVDGRLETLRDWLLLPPLAWRGWPFHSTIAHPRTSPDPVECWHSLRRTRLDVDVTIDEVLHTETDLDGRRVLATFPLRPAGRERVEFAGAILVRNGRVLLGRRAASRSAYPGVWDIVGGHVEPGESPRRALRRELGEELGIDANVMQPWRRVADDAGVALTVWIVDQWSGEPVNATPDEHDEIRWIDVDTLDHIPMVDARITRLVREALTPGTPG